MPGNDLEAIETSSKRGDGSRRVMAEPEDPPPGADGPMEGLQDVDNHIDSDVPELDAQRDHDSDVPEVSTKTETVVPLSMPLRSRQELVEEGSELGSVDASSIDALPRRVDSPIDSMLSGPDDSPSVQVCTRPSKALPSEAHRMDGDGCLTGLSLAHRRAL